MTPYVLHKTMKKLILLTYLFNQYNCAVSAIYSDSVRYNRPLFTACEFVLVK
jgi:hypothetical protein